MAPDMSNHLERHRPRLVALARCLTQQGDAEDLVQETMLVALDEGGRPRALGPWLRQVLRNRHRMRVRADVRRRAREAQSEQAASATSETERFDAVETQVSHNEVVNALQLALGQLDEPYREVMQQRFYEGRSAAEIARASDMPAGTVRWRINEGLRRMRKQLDDRHQGREAWFAALVALGLGTPAQASSPLKESQTMQAPMPIILATAALGIAGGALGLSFSQTHRPIPDHPTARVATGSPAPQAERTGKRAAYRRKLAGLRAKHALVDDVAHVAGERPHAAELPSADDPSGYMPAPPEFARLVRRCIEVSGFHPEGALFAHVLSDPEVGALVESIDFSELPEAPEDFRDCVSDALYTIEPAPLKSSADYTVQIFVPATDHVEAGHGRAHVEAIREIPGSWPEESRVAIDTRTLPRKGAVDGQVVMVQCGDFECPFTASARTSVIELLADHPEISFYFLHMPLGFHAHAMLKARAAAAAARQGLFWPAYDSLFEATFTDEAEARTWAQDLELDVDRFVQDLADPSNTDEVRRQAQHCQLRGASATPTFFINGVRIVGARSPAELDRLIARVASQPPPAWDPNMPDPALPPPTPSTETPKICDPQPREFVGLGMGFYAQEAGQGTRIHALLPGSPLADQGIGSGDEVLSIDGRPLAGLSAEQIRALTAGPVGSEVELEIKWVAGQVRRVRVERRAFEIDGPSCGGESMIVP